MNEVTITYIQLERNGLKSMLKQHFYFHSSVVSRDNSSTQYRRGTYCCNQKPRQAQLTYTGNVYRSNITQDFLIEFIYWFYKHLQCSLPIYLIKLIKSTQCDTNSQQLAASIVHTICILDTYNVIHSMYQIVILHGVRAATRPGFQSLREIEEAINLSSNMTASLLLTVYIIGH